MSRNRNGVRDTFFGRAGEMAVMSELLTRGWNVAVPEIDIGDDVFVVRDSNGEFKRVQVKSANAQQQNKSIAFQISISYVRLSTPVTPELSLVFPIRLYDKWILFVVITRNELYELYENSNIGRINKSGNINFRFKYDVKSNILIINKLDVSHYLNNWKSFPKIEH